METNRILVALDFDDKQRALEFVEQLQPQKCRLKVGKEMFTLFGPEFVRTLHDKGFEVFLDLKFHDIPNTVAKAVKAAAELGVWMVNVHASGGSKMMKAAKEALEPFGDSAPKLIAVTVLTSMDQDDLNDIGIDATPEQQVSFLANLAKTAGLDGVVCSAHEASMLKSQHGADFLLVTPGVRTDVAPSDDQKRVMTPKQAIEAGSDYLVIGRAITKSTDPLATLANINNSLNN